MNNLSCRINKGVIIVSLQGELDMYMAAEFRDLIDGCMQDSNIYDVVLDLSQVCFIDSSGVGAILGRYKKISSHAGKLSVIQPPANVGKILQMSGVFQLLTVYDDEAAALADY